MSPGHTMPLYQFLMLVTTQFMLAGGTLWSCRKVREVRAERPNKKWRWLALEVWLWMCTLSLIATTVVIAIGCPTLPVLHIIAWTSRICMVFGIVLVGVTATQMSKLYRDQ